MELKTLFSKYTPHAKNFSLYFVATIVKSLLVLMINPLLAKNLSHYDYSIMGYFTSFNSLFYPMMSFMLFQYYSRQFFSWDTTKRDYLLQALTSIQFIFGCIELFFIFVVFIILRNFGVVEFPVIPYVLLVFATLLFENVFSFLLVDYKIKRKARQFFVVSVMHAVISTLLALLLVVLYKFGARGRLLATLLTGVVFGGYAFYKIGNRLFIDKKILADSMSFCWPLIIAASLDFFYTGIDRSLLAGANDSVEYGLYNIAIRITGFLSLFTVALGQTFSPDIFRYASEKKFKKLYTIVGLIVLMSLLPTIVFNIFSRPILNILTAGRYVEAAKYGVILSFKNITYTLYTSISLLIVALGFTKITLLNKLLGALVSFVIFKILIGHFSYYGAAWGQVVSYFVLSIISFIFIVFKREKRTV